MFGVERVTLSARVVDETLTHLRLCGRRGVEGMVLWAGKIDGALATIEEAIVPRQDGRVTNHGLLVTVDGDELHRINVHLYRSKQRLIAQVHSHPGHAYHSEVDDEHAIATELGAFSVVVPDFAEGPFALEDYAVYRLSQPRWFWQQRPGWRKVRSGEINAIFTVGT